MSLFLGLGIALVICGGIVTCAAILVRALDRVIGFLDRALAYEDKRIRSHDLDAMDKRIEIVAGDVKDLDERVRKDMLARGFGR